MEPGRDGGYPGGSVWWSEDGPRPEERQMNEL